MKKGVKGNRRTDEEEKVASPRNYEMRRDEAKGRPLNIFKSMRFLKKHPFSLLVIESFIPTNKLSRLCKATSPDPDPTLVRDLFILA